MMGFIWLALVIPAAIWNAFVGNVLWGWFVTPIFGVSAPGVALFLGFSLLVRYVVKSIEPKTTTEEEYAAKIHIAVFGPAFVLLMGWIVTFFVGG